MRPNGEKVEKRWKERKMEKGKEMERERDRMSNGDGVVEREKTDEDNGE